ncbi:DUF2934 domain-containing protein [Rhizobium sp. P007]|uniref:DUF2934 domain-containing protein n=1 Tax=Rhizobium sp. P007 TaxID=285908 RepID=UPI00191BAC7A|nr:DUF2934 domain-containing protein [Rhizobium sp. P007]CAD7054971.1 hypothetical protein RP007_05534 [Rhizobium sp. P007]
MSEFPPESGSPVRVKVELRAYEIWVREGCPSGHDVDHWLQAETEMGSEQEQSEIVR